MLAWLKTWPRRRLALTAVALAALSAIAVNILANETVRTWRADVTASGLFTISPATREVLASLDEPVSLTLYYSRRIGERSPAYSRYAERVRTLLKQYADISGNRLQVRFVDPEPFSDEEDRAVAFGLQGLTIDDSGEPAYFGIVATNATDERATMPVLSLDRETFIEYDLTKLIFKLADPKRKVVGVVSTLPIAGGVDPRTRQRMPTWLIYNQLSEFYTVKMITGEYDAIPADVDVLLLVAPAPLGDRQAAAIEQFALAGKPVLAFIDAFSEAAGPTAQPMRQGGNVDKLLRAWGVEFQTGKIVGDIANARRVQYAPSGQPTVVSYVAWLALKRASFDPASPLFASVSDLVMASAGAFKPIKERTTRVAPLVISSPKAMLIDASRMVTPDPLALIRDYRPGNARAMLAARVSGPVKAVFTPAGDNKNKDGDTTNAATKATGRLTKGKINAVLIGDADMLYDTFWATVRQMAGRRLVIPLAGNADFVLNALEALSGGAALSGLRGRGVESRPFTLVQSIQRRAEASYRQREKALNAQLEELKKKLKEIQSRTRGGKVLLSDEDKRTIIGFREQIIAVRRDLRQVRRALRRDIDRLGATVKLANIAGVPVLIVIMAVIGAMIARRRRAHLLGKTPARRSGGQAA